MFATRSSLSDFVGRSPGVTELAKALHLKETEKEAETFVFLSHSHKDKKLAEWARDFFARFGKDVYVDWWDPDMPSSPNSETADRLRKKIKNEKSKFVLLATESSIDSEWVSWELGFADGVKKASAIATFPIAEQEWHWSGNEYMLLYPHITLMSGEWHVAFPDGMQLALGDWLSLDEKGLTDRKLGQAMRVLLSAMNRR